MKCLPPGCGRHLSLRCGRRRGTGGTAASATSWCLRPPCRRWGLRRRSAPYPPSCSSRRRRRRRRRGWRRSTTRSPSASQSPTLRWPLGGSGLGCRRSRPFPQGEKGGKRGRGGRRKRRRRTPLPPLSLARWTRATCSSTRSRPRRLRGILVRWKNVPYMNEMNKLIGEKALRGEEIILKHEKPALSLYGDCTHLYSQSSGRCWLDWRENRHRYVWRLGCTPRRTGLLLTSTYGQVCYSECVEQTRSDAPSDKTVKALICLLFDTSSHSVLQLGRVNAVCGRIHRMLKIGQSIVDYDEDLGNDDDFARKLQMRRRRWRRWESDEFASFFDFLG